MERGPERGVNDPAPDCRAGLEHRPGSSSRCRPAWRDRRPTKGKRHAYNCAIDRVGCTARAGDAWDVSVCINEQLSDYAVRVDDDVDAGLGALVQARVVD